METYANYFKQLYINTIFLDNYLWWNPELATLKFYYQIICLTITIEDKKNVLSKAINHIFFLYFQKFNKLICNLSLVMFQNILKEKQSISYLKL